MKSNPFDFDKYCKPLPPYGKYPFESWTFLFGFFLIAIFGPEAGVGFSRLGLAGWGGRLWGGGGGRSGEAGLALMHFCILISFFVFVFLLFCTFAFLYLGEGLGEAEVGEAGRPGRRSVLFNP